MKILVSKSASEFTVSFTLKNRSPQFFEGFSSIVGFNTLSDLEKVQYCYKEILNGAPYISMKGENTASFQFKRNMQILTSGNVEVTSKTGKPRANGDVQVTFKGKI